MKACQPRQTLREVGATLICGMPEASDPEFWTLMLYGPTGDRPPEDEAAEGPMEF